MKKKNTKRAQRRRRRMLKRIRVICTWALMAAVIVLVVVLIVKCCSKEKTETPDNTATMYLSSDGSMLKAFQAASSDTKSTEETTAEASELLGDVSGTWTELPRGTEVVQHETLYAVNDKDQLKKVSKAEEGQDVYYKIEANGQVYYISPDCLVEDYASCITETVKYVRTSVTLYETAHEPEIASFIRKGEELQVVGFDSLDEEGNVSMYQIKHGDETGWVYGKYLVDDQESADAVYQEIYDIHAGREYSFDLHGGATELLDWYPYERTTFEDHELLQDARAMYLNANAALNYQDYIDLALESGVNAMVVDLKDGYLAYESDVAKEMSPTSYAAANASVEDYGAAIKAMKDAGLYVIGRIVVFNDSKYGEDHPEDCISASEEYLTSYWPSAYDRDAWYYNVCLAKEAVELFDFDEIQFDYIRFPENTWTIIEEDSTADFRNAYDETASEAIQNFLFYACDQLHESGVYLSVDVFGECVAEYTTAYGQYWPAISNIVDAISGMPYTDHYGRTDDTWSDPYWIMNVFASSAAERQKEIATPAVVRTWITGYDTPFWDPTVDYDAGKLEDQAQALYDNGLTGGFIPWNSASDISKYEEYAAAWSYDY